MVGPRSGPDSPRTTADTSGRPTRPMRSAKQLPSASITGHPTTAVLPLGFRQEPREDDAVVLIVVGPQPPRTPHPWTLRHPRSLAVANGSEEAHVVTRPAHAVGMMQVGDSDCGPEGQAWRVGAADGQQPSAVGTNTTVEESWRIIGALGRCNCAHLQPSDDPSRSLTIWRSRPAEARWI
jgi:hypothetical protein